MLAYIDWVIEPDCTAVRIVSLNFSVEDGYDDVTINGVSYSGQAIINQMVYGKFIINFKSDRTITDTGFYFSWSCEPLEGRYKIYG